VTPLTIACVLVKGEYAYTPEYVRRLLVMCRRYVSRPFDQPKAMPEGVRPITVQRLEGCFAEWTKMRLFDVFRNATGRILFIDLDSLIVNSLDPIIDYSAPIAIIDDIFALERAHLTTDRYGRRLVRKFQGSVFVWDAGTHADIWDRWTLQDALRLSTSQDWMAEIVPDAAAMPDAWFPRASKTSPPWSPDHKIVLAKKPKGFEAVQKWPWFNEWWGGWA
jgi:hypothetical protein